MMFLIGFGLGVAACYFGRPYVDMVVAKAMDLYNRLRG